jgi:transposase-like protein
VATLSRRHDVHPSLIYAWRRESRHGSGREVELVPVTVASEKKPVVGGGVIEIDLGKGVRLRVDCAVDEAALGRVLRALGR